MSPVPTMTAFARRLRAATAAGKLEWKRSPFEPDMFEASAASGTVTLTQVTATGGGIVTTLRVRDAIGQDVDSLETDPSRPGPWYTWEENLMQMYDEARMVASGTTRVLEGLSQEWDLPADPEEDVPF